MLTFYLSHNSSFNCYLFTCFHLTTNKKPKTVPFCWTSNNYCRRLVNRLLITTKTWSFSVSLGLYRFVCACVCVYHRVAAAAIIHSNNLCVIICVRSLHLNSIICVCEMCVYMDCWLTVHHNHATYYIVCKTYIVYVRICARTPAFSFTLCTYIYR